MLDRGILEASEKQGKEEKEPEGHEGEMGGQL